MVAESNLVESVEGWSEVAWVEAIQTDLPHCLDFRLMLPMVNCLCLPSLKYNIHVTIDTIPK